MSDQPATRCSGRRMAMGFSGLPAQTVFTVTLHLKADWTPKREDLVAGYGEPDPDIRWAAVSGLGRIRPVKPDHGEQAITAIKRFAEEIPLHVQVDDLIVETDEEAQARGCQGSPTILIEGRDLEPEARGGVSFGVT